MSNTKAEIVDAAVDAGLGNRDDLDALTKADLIALWG
jgi:hypothetical protein